MACVQAATPLLQPAGDAALVSALKSLLVDMASSDRDPAIKTQAAKLLKAAPYDGLTDAAPMEH